MKIIAQQHISNKTSCNNVLLFRGREVYKFNTPTPLLIGQYITINNNITDEKISYKIISNSTIWIEEGENEDDVQYLYDVQMA